MATVAFDHVEKIYPDGSQAVFDLNLDIADGEFMVLVGPSGCGKTTGLRMVAGLEEISGGEIRIDDEVVNGVEPRKRDVAMVFQNYALYPNMSVFENIAFPLRARRMSRADVRERVEKAAGLLDLTEHLKRRPKNLSGGQRQRVAMGRAIVRQPKLFLMDEPLSNLDAKLRMQMRGEISRLQRDLGVTTLYVTHDQVEAMTMGHRITVMRKGVLQQCGTPQDLYDNPVNLFVATFIGSPAMNLFRASVEQSGDGLVCRSAAGDVPVAPGDPAAGPLREFVGREVAVGVRPEHMALAEPGAADGPRVAAEVSLIEALGSEQLVHLEMDAAPVVTEEVLEIAQDTDAAVVSHLQHEGEAHKAGIVARLSARAKIAPGETVQLAIEPDQLHFFDVASGRALR